MQSALCWYAIYMEMLDGKTVILFESATAWRDWLDHNYGLEAGIWLKIAKKGSGVASVTRAEALDVALCYGWIDGQARSLNEVYFLQKYTPRRAKSLWSKVNIDKVAVLIEAGLMQAPGYTAIAAAQADGRWDVAYEPQRTATVPADFAAALAQNIKAQTFFDSLNKAARYAFLWRLMTAKTAKTRAAWIPKMIAMLESGTHFH